MLRAMVNRATMRLADTTKVSGRVTAESVDPRGIRVMAVVFAFLARDLAHQ